MLQDRNETSHAYDEALARRICANVRRYAPEMERAYGVISRRPSAP
jgi:Nucleotidyltransferase substrate binding protein like